MLHRLCPSALGKRLGRKKIILDSDATKLDRCLTTFDLTALGIGRNPLLFSSLIMLDMVFFKR